MAGICAYQATRLDPLESKYLKLRDRNGQNLSVSSYETGMGGTEVSQATGLESQYFKLSGWNG